MPDYQAILKEIENQVVALATSTISECKNEAIQDGKNLLSQMSSDLIRWMKLVAEKQLTSQEFEWLINSDKDQVKMDALEKAGLAAERVEQFSITVLKVIANIALKSLIPL